MGIILEDVFAFHSLPQLLRDRNLNILDVKSRTDTYISYSLIGMASFLLIVICYLAVFATESQSIQLLTGLFGILVGYLVGNRSNAERVAHL